MLYPFSLRIDAYIQAESYEEACEIAGRIEEDVRIDTDICGFVGNDLQV